MRGSYTCIIVDDEPKAIELLKDCLKDLYSNLEVIGMYTSWNTALSALRTTKCDILFLDISMPGKNGMELLSLIPGLDCEIIFITAHSDYALNSFKFFPSGYILKPIDDKDLTVGVDKAIQRIINKKLSKNQNHQAGTSKIGIPDENGIYYLSPDEILYFVAEGNCTSVVTKDRVILSSYNLSRFKSIVEPKNFYQVHRSYIVNVDHIKRYTLGGLIVMANGTEIPITKNMRDEFLLIFNKVTKSNF